MSFVEKFALTFLFLMAAPLLAAAPKPAKYGNFEVDSAGRLCFGDAVLDFQVWNEDWSQAVERKTLKNFEGYPHIKKGSEFRSSGVLLANGKKKFSYSENFKFASKDVCFLSARHNLDIKGFRYADLTFSIPLDECSEGVFWDGKLLAFPYSETSFSRRAKVKNCRVEFASGVLTLEGDMDLFVQDNRRFNSSTVSFRIFFQKTSEGESGVDLKITYHPHKSRIVDLKKLFNSKLDCGKLPQGKRYWGKIIYDISPTDGCLEIPAGGEAEISFGGIFDGNLYLLNAFAGDSPLSGEVALVCPKGEDSGGQVSVLASDTNSFGGENQFGVWRTKPSGERVRKLYSTKVKLGGKKASGVKLVNKTSQAWKIAAATVSTANFTPASLYCNFIAEDEKYVPMDFTAEVEKGSALDMSGLMDAPAGKYGFVQTDGARLFFENKKDADFRVFGNNLCFAANYPTRENAERLADTFARIGYNSVRFHHYDRDLVVQSSPDGLEFNAENLDRLDYLMAKMKERGIYITTDLYVSRGIKKGILEPEFEAALEKAGPVSSSSGTLKAMFFLSEKAEKNFQAFAANLLNHVNPYTKLAWKDDPALLSLSLVNENTIEATVNADTLPLYNARFEKWLKEKPEEVSGGDRKYLFRRFLHELYMGFYNRQKAFLRGLGVKALLTDQNYWGGLSLALESEHYDIVDTHYYYGHPSFIKRPWSLPAKLVSKSSLGSFNNGVGKGAQTVKDKPFYITEWSHVLNNDNAAEGAFLMGAYGAMQGWTGLYRFTYSHSEIDFNQRPIGFFDSSSNPIATLSDRAAALFLLRGDVKKSKVAIPYLIARDTLERPMKEKSSLLRGNPNILNALSMYARVEGLFSDRIYPYKKADGSKFAVASEPGWIEAASEDSGKIVRAWDFDESLLPETFGKSCDLAGGVFKSSTGELVVDQKKLTLKICTPRSEAFIAPEGSRLKGGFARANFKKGRSAVLVASVEKRPLRFSDRILILHLSGIKNTNMKFSDPEMTILEEWGSLPILARSAETELTLDGDFSGWKLYALSPGGKRLFEVPFVADTENQKTSIRLKTVRGKDVIFAYELAKQ